MIEKLRRIPAPGETIGVLPPATKADLAIDIDGFWKPSEGLQTLVDKTNPDLGKIPTQEGHTDDELLALLLSLKDESSVFKKDVTPGIAAHARSGESRRG